VLNHFLLYQFKSPYLIIKPSQLEHFYSFITNSNKLTQALEINLTGRISCIKFILFLEFIWLITKKKLKGEKIETSYNNFCFEELEDLIVYANKFQLLFVVDKL
jgi:hypothetical protein